MEIDNDIIGYTLNEIQKKPDKIKLVFRNSKTNKSYILTFNGLLFETSGSPLNRRVKNIKLDNTLGFRALTQLQRLHRNPENYRQLFIQMEGSNEDNKLELIGALRNYRISPKAEASIRSKVAPRANRKRKVGG
jgi:hypothetical protein